jgi:hypothetical protein
MQVGMKVTAPPIPPIAADIEMFEAGAVSFGVEYRRLTDALLDRHLADHRMDRTTIAQPATGSDDRGVSIHVFGADGHEYLRFDCFEDGPHYHYIRPGQDHQVVAPFDAAANGDPLDWTLSRLRERLGPMLRAAGGDAVAEACDPTQVGKVLDRVEAAARAAA